MSLVFQDEHIEVHAARSRSPHLLVTFAPSTMLANGRDFWGQGFAAKAGLSILGFIAKSSNWFPQASVEAAIAACADLLAAYPERITYGTSMGGYAAIRYSGSLGARTCIAFAPQVSIDPARVGHVDRRFTGYYDPRKDKDPTITAAGVHGDVFVFFDPYLAVDLWNVEQIVAAVPAARLVKVPRVGHQPIELFAGTKIASTLIEDCRRGDLGKIGRAVRNLRRGSLTRIIGLAEQAAARRPDLAYRLFNAHKGRITAIDRRRILFRLATGYLAHGRLTEAETLAAACWSLGQEDAGTLRLMSDIAYRRGKLDDALSLLTKSQHIDGGYPFTYSRRAAVLLDLGRLAEAREAIDTALGSLPDEKSFLRLQSRADMLEKQALERSTALPAA